MQLFYRNFVKANDYTSRLFNKSRLIHPWMFPNVLDGIALFRVSIQNIFHEVFRIS